MSTTTPGCGPNSEARKRAAETTDPHAGCTSGTCRETDTWRTLTCSPDAASMTDEVAALRRWKTEALPVLDGLQDLGKALGVPLGERITGPVAVDAALDLRNEVAALRATVTRVAALADAWSAVPPHLATAYDRGRVEQREMCEEELRSVLDFDPSSEQGVSRG